MKVLKYQTIDGATVLVPKHGKVLHVAFQQERPTVWMLVPDGEQKLRQIRLRPTGADVPDHAIFVGTMMNDDHTFVLHAFEDY